MFGLIYWLDKLALRAGNEKDEDEADTVGCCSLRKEHIKLHKSVEGVGECVVEFDFLGKDSIRYNNSVAVDKRVYKNLILFMENKNNEDELFDRLNVSAFLGILLKSMAILKYRVYSNFQLRIYSTLLKLSIKSVYYALKKHI